MSDKFVASNGVVVQEWVTAGWLRVGNPYDLMSAIPEGWVVALREFFQHERDEELGRWRWPDDPRYVVYPLEGGDEVRVLDDGRGQSVTARRSNLTPGITHTHFVGAALAYFAAHPEPKPWHDAKPGEVWEFTYSQMGAQDRHVAFSVDSFKRFRTADGVRVDLDECMVVSARRVYPEVSDVAE